MKTTVIAGAAFLSLSCFTGCGLKTQGGPPGGGGDPCKSTGGVCKIAIAVAAGSCTNGSCVSADPDSRHVGDGTGNVKDVNLLWTLPNGYAFCDGDGIAFKGNTDGQFSANYPTDDGNGNPDSAGGHKKNYHWKDANTAKGGPYKYTIRFHDDQCGTAFEKDPDIVNDM